MWLYGNGHGQSLGSLPSPAPRAGSRQSQKQIGPRPGNLSFDAQHRLNNGAVGPAKLGPSGRETLHLTRRLPGGNVMVLNWGARN